MSSNVAEHVAPSIKGRPKVAAHLKPKRLPDQQGDYAEPVLLHARDFADPPGPREARDADGLERSASPASGADQVYAFSISAESPGGGTMSASTTGTTSTADDSFAPATASTLSIGAVAGGSLLLVAAAAASGLGGGSSGSASSASAGRTLGVTVMAGPLTEAVKVEAFDKDGKLVGTATSDATGHVQLSLAAGFSGPVLLKATALSGAGITYVDEATGLTKTFVGALRAIVVVDGNTDVNITPLSELAVSKMGVVADNANVGLDTIASVDQTISRIFGVAHATAPATNVLDTRYDESDGVSIAERFGQQLAALSGADAVTGSAAATVTKLADTIDLSTGTMSSVGLDLLATGRTIFASNQNAALAKLIASTVPAAPSITNDMNAASMLASGPLADGKADAVESAAGISIPVALSATAVAGDVLTDAASPTMSGSLAASLGATDVIGIYDTFGGVTTRLATVTPTGSGASSAWSYTPTLAAGTHTLVAVVEASGNSSLGTARLLSPSRTITVDASVPTSLATSACCKAT